MGSGAPSDVSASPGAASTAYRVRRPGVPGSGAVAAGVVMAFAVAVLAAGTSVLRPFADGSVDHSSQLVRALLGALLALGIAVVIGAILGWATTPRSSVVLARRLTGGLTGGTLALLALTTVAVGATAGIATLDVSPNTSSPATTVPIERDTPPTPPPRVEQPIDADAQSIRFPFWLTVILVVAAAIVAALGLLFGLRSIRIPTLRKVGRLFHGSGAPTTVEEPAIIDLDAAADSFADSADVIGDDDDPRAAIIAAYAHLLDRLDEAGCTRRAAEAPEEHLRRSLNELRVPAASLQLVVAKFLIARFSRHDVTEADRDEVRRALRAAANELRETTAPSTGVAMALT